jgi:hypothetical protein
VPQLPGPKGVGNALQGPKGVCNGSIVHTNIDEDEVGHREAAQAAVRETCRRTIDSVKSGRVVSPVFCLIASLIRVTIDCRHTFFVFSHLKEH